MKSILLLHGWNYKNYTNQTKSKDAWDNRKDLVKRLEKKYKVYKLNFPGFCGQEEPNKPYNLSDYALYVKEYIDKNKIKVDYILGYSFGGAVAVLYNLLYDRNSKLILISPALARKYNNKNIKVTKTPKFIEPLRNKVRDFYLINIVKNPYMKYGTKFLRESYQSIVREDIVDKVKDINNKNVLIILGSDDEMVNTDRIINELEGYNINVIKNGKHDIANTHLDDIIALINNY